MLKPIRVKYGSTNPNKSLRMKYHLPIQYPFQSFELGQFMTHTMKIFPPQKPSKKRFSRSSKSFLANNDLYEDT